jgi:hypothetical protein
MSTAMDAKPVSDPETQELTADQIIVSAKNGKAKITPVTGLADAQVEDVVSYFRTLK